MISSLEFYIQTNNRSSAKSEYGISDKQVLCTLTQYTCRCANQDKFHRNEQVKEDREGDMGCRTEEKERQSARCF